MEHGGPCQGVNEVMEIFGYISCLLCRACYFMLVISCLLCPVCYFMFVNGHYRGLLRSDTKNKNKKTSEGDDI